MLYLLHATLPVNATGRHPAQHYLGYSPSRSTLRLRVRRHRNGQGSHLTLAMSRIPGQQLILANVWEGDPAEERLLKRRKKLRQWCPLCNPRALIGSVDTPLPRPLSRASNERFSKRASTTGGGSPPGNKTQAATWSPRARRQGSGT